MVRHRALSLLGFLCALVWIGVQPPVSACADTPKKPPAEDPEVRLGRENAAANDKLVKLVTDAARLERVNRIGQEIAAVANAEPVPVLWGLPERKQFEYTFKIVEDKDVNAYSLPGGFIYVHTGLLDYLHSDDELAGVLAHEVAHAAHRHMMKLLSEQSKMQRNLLLPILLTALLTRSGGQDLGNLLLAGQLYMVAKLNSYGVEAEKDADQAAVRYLMKTKYNPVGLLTFMERLARDELRGPERELGIFRTHPPSPERARALLALLEALRIPIHRRAADPTLSAQVGTATVNGMTLAEVKMHKTVIVRLAASDGLSGTERARRFSDSLNRLLDEGLQMHEVRLASDKVRVLARNQTLLAFTQADADAQKTTIAQLSQDALAAIKNLLWQDQFNRVPSTAGAKP